MTKSIHLHKYKKINLSKTDKEYLVYRCQKPMCSHYIPIKLAAGKMCECNRCGEPMILDKTQLTGSGGYPMTNPHCIECKGSKKTNELAKIAKFLENIGNK